MLALALASFIAQSTGAVPAVSSKACVEATACAPQEEEEAEELSMLQLASSLSKNIQQHTEPGTATSPTYGKSAHFWYRSNGDLQSSSAATYTAPTDFSKGPAVKWDNPLDEEVRHSPLIDKDKNVYVMAPGRILKMNPDLNMIWEWKLPPTPGFEGKQWARSMRFAPALDGQYLYAVSANGLAAGTTVYCISIENATLVWKSDFPLVKQAGDSGGLLVHNDTVLVPATTGADGSNALFALNSSDGSHMWDYVTDDVMWNFKPSTPGDGSIIFSSSCGAVHRIDWSGQLLWKKPAPIQGQQGGGFCSMGGGAVGPNGMFYAEHGANYPPYAQPPGESGKAWITAYKISDGTLVWQKEFDVFGGQYPAVGYLGDGGPLAVVAPMGTTLGMMGTSLQSAQFRSTIGSLPPGMRLINAVVALDAATGEQLWRFDEEPWDSPNAAGDEGRPVFNRITMKEYNTANPSPFCLPDPQGVPLIGGDGTVYATSGHNGDLYALKDVDKDGKISASEMSTFSTHMAFLNSPSIAPNMLVAAPCWGPIYIFRD